VLVKWTWRNCKVVMVKMMMVVGIGGDEDQLEVDRLRW